MTERTRAACTWCGIPSGMPGVRLRKVTVVEGRRYVAALLCDPCWDEHAKFGRRLPFWDWLALFLVELGTHAKMLLSVRRNLTQIVIQWRFRARGAPVRGEIAERVLRRVQSVNAALRGEER